MKTIARLPSALPRFILLSACALFAAAALRAQSAPTSTSAVQNARNLAKYDVNKNGVLDADELAALRADEAKAAGAVETRDAARDEVVQLSPFEVNSGNDKGYSASNTLAGTRLNSKLEDLAGSVSVVTKQQLLDTAALDINDIFLYEVATEGTGQFTDLTNDGRGEGLWDNVTGNPTGANRMRGLSSANVASNGFTVSGTIPIDTYNIDAVEIARGPNSQLAGLSDAGGTVNLVNSRANTSRETTNLVMRVDNLGGYRVSMDLNRPIIKNKLAVRFSAVLR